MANSRSDRSVFALLRSIWVYEEDEDSISAAAAFGSRRCAVRHLIWHPIIFSVLPRAMWEVTFEGNREEPRMRRFWQWRGRCFAFGEWREGFPR